LAPAGWNFLNRPGFDGQSFQPDEHKRRNGDLRTDRRGSEFQRVEQLSQQWGAEYSCALFDNDFVLEQWATANLQPSSAFSVGGSEAPNRITVHAPWADKTMYWDYGDYSGGRVSVNCTNYLDAWTYVTVTFNASDNSHRIYLNGIQAAATINSNSPVNTQTGFTLGTWLPYYEKGNLDEFRISNSARSTDWIATDYNNQKSPSTFYSVGAAQ
jgi:hypothetical protein